MTDSKSSLKRRWISFRTPSVPLFSKVKIPRAQSSKVGMDRPESIETLTSTSREAHKTRQLVLSRTPSNLFLLSRRLQWSRTRKSTPLLQLVLRCEWQKVLIRASLFPNEILQQSRCVWYGVEWDVLPIHIACALDPPVIVIEKLLSISSTTDDMTTAARTMTRTRRKLKYSKASAHQNLKVSQKLHSLIKMPLSWRRTTSTDGGVVLAPTIDESSHEPSPITGAKEFWHSSDGWLPIHLACLFRASPGVLKQLIQVHPTSVTTWIGASMGPMHLLTVGWSIPTPNPLFMTKEIRPWRMEEALQILIAADPDSTYIPSRNHGLTPLQYLDCAMEDGVQKSSCRNVLGAEFTKPGSEEEEQSAVASFEIEEFPLDDLMVPCEIVCDDSPVDNDDFGSCSEEAARRAPIELLSLMVNQEWEIVYDWLEDEPELTHQWNYGIETECDETLLWKRLPIHSACRQGAPISVLSIILRHNPSCPPDPYTGSLPIHLACRHFPKLSTVQVLLYTDPTSSRRQDNSGKLALHYAVMHKAPKSVLQLLLKSYPTSVITEDNNGHTPLDYCALECMDANVLKTMMRLKSFLGRVETRKQREMMRNQSSNMCLAIGSKSDDYIL